MTKLRHYEIIFLVHPDKSDQVPSLIQLYENIVKSSKGHIHRLEDWGKRQLAYPIKKAMRAHYVLMNIECNDKALGEINHNFRFNESILRHLILHRDTAQKEPSPIFRSLQAQEMPSSNPTSQAEVKDIEAVQEIAE